MNLKCLFFGLLEKPSSEKFIKLRSQIIATGEYAPYSGDYDALMEYLEKGKFRNLINRFEKCLPNLLLSPTCHLALSCAFRAEGDEEMAHTEKRIADLLVTCLLRTGNGTPDRPYLVLRSEDEYDILQVLGKTPVRQDQIDDNGRHLDRQICTDGTELHFDITAAYEAIQ